MKITIFYSWQSNTDANINWYFIRNCIEEAIAEIHNDIEFKNISYSLIESTAGLPGSPEIATIITDDRIPNSDIFIADVSVINRLNWAARFFAGNSYRPMQNNNVMIEYGVAKNAIGVAGIIGIMNSNFGSPSDDPKNIPFDLRHMRWPIEYALSKASQINRVKNDLVKELVPAIKGATIEALKNQRERYKPFVGWTDWEKILPSEQQYIAGNTFEKIRSTLLQDIGVETKSIRIVGLSGLGKTRLLFETFRPENDKHESVIISGRVLYIDYSAYPGVDLQDICTRLYTKNEDRILIIDNCPSEVHKRTFSYIQKPESKLSLITLNSNPEEAENDRIPNVSYIAIKKEELADVVDGLLDRDFNMLSSDERQKIREFSQGIPLMAVLLGNSVKNDGEKFIGKLSNKDLLNKLLGAKGNDRDNRTILMACSIFNYFGFYDDLRPELEFIAANKDITPIEGTDVVVTAKFHELYNHYRKREIFEKRGRWIGMRPFPLAISLAHEWLETCTNEKLLRVINSIAGLKEPHRKNLSDGLAEQMRFLGYNSNAVSLVEQITGPDSPFDNAEVLNTELGSRLFRSFVEVNPIAISNNLHRLFANKSKDELLNVVEGRRNLIWTLEKVVFHQLTFIQGAKVLFKFAISENETWSNNATGQLLHLFKILLPGTEADLVDRFEIIKWALEQDDQEYRALAYRAMSSGLDYGHFSRMGGAERQGSMRLEDFKPSDQQIATYWTDILEILTQAIEQDSEMAVTASKIVASSIRGITMAGFSEILMPFVRRISVAKRNDWDEGLESLKRAKKYDSNTMSKPIFDEVVSAIVSLTKSDFITKYKTSYLNFHLEAAESYSESDMKSHIMGLADEFIESNVSWDLALPVLYSTQQTYSFAFGQRLYELLESKPDRVDEFIEASIHSILRITPTERNLNILGGFLRNTSDELKHKFYFTLVEIEELIPFLFFFIGDDKNGAQYFDLLFDLVDSGKTSISNFFGIRFGALFDSFNDEEATLFFERLLTYGIEGAKIAFELAFTMIFHDPKKKSAINPILARCIHKIGFKNLIDQYKESEVVVDILSGGDQSEFAKFVNETIIESISWENTYHLDTYIRKIYEVLIKQYFNEVWPSISSALLSDTDREYVKYYGLKHILGSHIGELMRGVGILFDGDTEKIFEWAGDNAPLAAIRLAELVPVYAGENNDYEHWNPICLRLIDEHGSKKEVLQSLSANIGTFSWTGSMVPLLIQRKLLFQAISNHSIPLVREWAESYLNNIDSQIQREKDNDAEFGIFG